MPSFKSKSGGHVRIFRPDGSMIDIDEAGSYETDDELEVQALRDSPEVGEEDDRPDVSERRATTRDENPEPTVAARGPRPRATKKAR